MKKSYEIFSSNHNRETNQKSAVKMNQLVRNASCCRRLFNLHSQKFVVSTSLLQFSRKSRNSRTRRLEQKPDVKVSLLSEFLKKKEEARKVLKNANMP